MKKLRYAVLSLLIASCALVSCQDELLPDQQRQLSESSTEDTKVFSSSTARDADWELVWSDEFNFFDDSKWTKINAPSGINNDLAYLTPANVWIQNGNLRIRANNNSIGGRNFTGGKVMTKNKFDLLYGRVEVRVRTASTYGSHTAAWLLNEECDGINPCAAWPPEIDIVEVIGRDPSEAFFNVHHGVQSSEGRWSEGGKGITFNDASSNITPSPAPGSAFHEYAIEWEENEIRWYLDGSNDPVKTWNPNNSTSFMPSERMFIILDIVVGGDWAGTPNGSSVWPQYADFDYVRVYKRGTPPPMDRAT